MVNAVVAFVIVSYNTAELLRECLESVYGHAAVPCVVVVVDNASKDGSVEMVRSEFPRAHLIANCSNEGYPRAVNQGLRVVDAPYYFVLNSDVCLTEHTVATLITHMETHRRAGISAPAQQTPDGDLVLAVYKDPSLRQEMLRNLLFFDLWRYRVFGASLAKRMRQPIRADWVMGAALFVRREMVRQVGGMDDSVLMYGEEFDWAYRARMNGWDVYLVPDSVVTHRQSASANRALGARRYALVVKSNYYFYAKHFGLARLPFYVLAQLAGSILRVLLACPLALLGSTAARYQCLEHLYTIRTSLDPKVYRWILRTLRGHTSRGEP